MGIEHFRYSILLNSITDIFGNTEIPKIPKYTENPENFPQIFPTKNPKKFAIFFWKFFRIFGIFLVFFGISRYFSRFNTKNVCYWKKKWKKIQIFFFKSLGFFQGFRIFWDFRDFGINTYNCSGIPKFGIEFKISVL